MSDLPVRPRYSLIVCDSQPLTIAGIRAVTAAHTEFDLVADCDSIIALRDIASRVRPAVVLVDKMMGLDSLPSWLHDSGAAATIVWGSAISEPEAVRLLKAGVQGILRKTASADTLLACLRAVVEGHSWMEESVFRAGTLQDRARRSGLTARERQVMELVEAGLKNRDIAAQLGIRPGTVKIHLKHIFEKTGVRGRYGLALSGLKDRGVLEIATTSAGGR
ncbi:MAG: response regulator transcription factor [Acidobacteria bacterium]|nr:response regulator transcription factor [Acidobacteriota bacterium]